MKAFMLFALLVSTSVVQAMPFVCESQEKVADKPVLRFKVNAEREVQEKNGSVWRKFLLGVTPGRGIRKIIYGSGHANGENGVGLTIVEDGFVTGYVKAYHRIEGGFEGDASIGGVEKGHAIPITCVDEAPAVVP